MRWVRRVWRATIWHPASIPPLERKYAQPLKWVVFPAFDLAMLLVAARALVVGIPSIEALMPQTAALTLYWVWAAAAALCFIGTAFPRLWVLEIGGKIALFAMLTVYLIALRINDAGDGTRDAVSLFVVVAMLFPLLRLWILGIEERDRRGS